MTGRRTLSAMLEEFRSDSTPERTTCCPVHASAVPGVPAKNLACIPLLNEKDPQWLMRTFRAAPQFAALPVAKLLEEQRGGVRAILLTECGYYAQQAAVYLATFAHMKRAGRKEEEETEDSWEWTSLEDMLEEAEQSDPFRNALAVLSPRLLDPALRESGKERGAVILRSGGEEGFRPDQVPAPAILIAAPSGPVLTERTVEQIAELSRTPDGGERELFIALRPGQVELELLEELRFSYGFHVCRVGRPDQDYLRRFLAETARELMYDLDGSVDLDQVIAQTRRYRGSGFNETDLEKLVLWAVQRQAGPPLQSGDLIFTPFQEQKTGWNELKGMTGLENVKGSMRRQLAAAVLEDRRREKGQYVDPMCRNMAFSGPPGTGKSTAARLAARILREEGCGSGRFVEAGREQLIGGYLGQTSPMVADLFEQARGGVLFIDEAGALLDGSGGQDHYASEAVNALVRHMELEPETMVIFATYPEEMRDLLESNPGLSSRVAQVLDFPGYDDGELWEIMQSFAKKAGYVLPEGAEEVCGAFFRQLRRRKGENFGNAREARRLFQGAVEEMALRVLDEDAEETMTLSDLEQASRRLMVLPERNERIIGFRA